ncbi:hypothetical protein [Fusibacter sp. 3D3]|uniref:hypothetical protein n=1 Tax=Fusibacter sp. 3D3 TaxID=1048380 RepID=UPI00085394BB|nr:hypothetical protein [Fusibacter sp. 3D3]GAU78418.1 hypothetical protein F3D3_3052 [Fusibacter sp. 3D3]
MIKLIEKKPYTAPTVIERDVRNTSELEKELNTHFTQLSIGSDLYLLSEVSEEYEALNIVLDDKAISGTVYVVRGTPSKITSITDDDMMHFKAVARFIEFN